MIVDDVGWLTYLAGFSAWPRPASIRSCGSRFLRGPCTVAIEFGLKPDISLSAIHSRFRCTCAVAPCFERLSTRSSRHCARACCIYDSLLIVSGLTAGCNCVRQCWMDEKRENEKHEVKKSNLRTNHDGEGVGPVARGRGCACCAVRTDLRSPCESNGSSKR